MRKHRPKPNYEHIAELEKSELGINDEPVSKPPGKNRAKRRSEDWRLVERYVEHYPYDWRLIFRRGDETLEISVPEDVWRSFDRKQDQATFRPPLRP